MYLVTKIENDGTENSPFIVDLAGLTTLMSMATPGKCSFTVKRISYGKCSL